MHAVRAAPIRGMDRAVNYDAAVLLAVHFVDRHVPAFPIALRWDDERNHIAKRPLTGNGGFRNAGRNGGEVRNLFRDVRHVDKAVGAGNEIGTEEVLGVGAWLGPANILALDVDTKNGATGDTQLADLEAQYGELPETVRVITASGGVHVWLHKPAGRQIGSTTLARHIDVRADNGFVVAPGTTTEWGSWTFDGPSFLAPECAPVAECPWILDLLTRRARGNGDGCDAHPDADFDIDKLPPQIRRLLAEQITETTDRSDRAYHFVGRAIEAGLDDSTILAAITHYPPAVEKYGSRLDSEARRAISKLRVERARPVTDEPHHSPHLEDDVPPPDEPPLGDESSPDEPEEQAP